MINTGLGGLFQNQLQIGSRYQFLGGGSKLLNSQNYIKKVSVSSYPPPCLNILYLLSGLARNIVSFTASDKTSRKEKLKLWREQKQKQKEQEKKNAPKTFALSTRKIEHKEDSCLYQDKVKSQVINICFTFFACIIMYF